jgi:hypothetical protein
MPRSAEDAALNVHVEHSRLLHSVAFRSRKENELNVVNAEALLDYRVNYVVFPERHERVKSLLFCGFLGVLGDRTINLFDEWGGADAIGVAGKPDQRFVTLGPELSPEEFLMSNGFIPPGRKRTFDLSWRFPLIKASK